MNDSPNTTLEQAAKDVDSTWDVDAKKARQAIIESWESLKPIKPIVGDIIVTHRLLHVSIANPNTRDEVQYKFSNRDMPEYIRRFKRRFNISVREFLTIFNITKNQYKNLMAANKAVTEDLMFKLIKSFAPLRICNHIELVGLHYKLTVPSRVWDIETDTGIKTHD